MRPVDVRPVDVRPDSQGSHVNSLPVHMVRMLTCLPFTPRSHGSHGRGCESTLSSHGSHVNSPPVHMFHMVGDVNSPPVHIP